MEDGLTVEECTFLTELIEGKNLRKTQKLKNCDKCDKQSILLSFCKF